MSKETKIGRTTYIITTNFRADDKGTDISSVLLRLMEKDLNDTENLVKSTIENNFDIFKKGAAGSSVVCYNKSISQNDLGLVGSVASCSPMQPGCKLQAKEGALV